MQRHLDVDVAIVRATMVDLPAIATLAREIWRRHYPGIITGEQIEYMLDLTLDDDRMVRQIEDEGIIYDRLLVDGKLAGYAAYGPVSASETKLDKLYLSEQWRGCGLGKRLLDHVVAEAARAGSQAIVLNVNKRNRSSIAFYERNGFLTRREVVVDIGGGFVMDDFVMARRLPQRDEIYA